MSEASLASLRSAGAWRLDPARFRYLEALARRLDGQPAAVRVLLQEKLQAAVAEYAQRHARSAPSANAGAQPPRRTAPARCVPLAQLNEHIRAATAGRRDPSLPCESLEQDELASVRAFRQAWSRSQSLAKVDQAVARKPANAGPLNSHALVLQSLALMQDLSPDYLRRFLVQVESLQWLEQAAEKYPPPQAKGAKVVKRGRSKGR